MIVMCSKLLCIHARHHIKMGVSGNMAISSPVLWLEAGSIHTTDSQVVRTIDANYHLKKYLSRVKVHSHRINK